jgi:hypothetical protein
MLADDLERLQDCLKGVYRLALGGTAVGCAFRRLRPLIPVDRDHLFRSIATSVTRVCEIARNSDPLRGGFRVQF